MATGERGCRRAVGDPLGDERAPGPAWPVVDDRQRPRSGSASRPRPAATRRRRPRRGAATRSKPPIGAERVGAHDDRRGGDVAEPGPGSDAARLRTEVERRVPLLVAGDGAGARRAGDAWRDEPDAIVGEVQEQRIEPAGHEPDVGVDEGDEGSRRRAQAGVAGDGRAGVGPQAQHGGAGDGADRRLRGVVDGDHAGDAGAAAHDLGERRLTEHERRDDDRHVGSGVRRRPSGAGGSRRRRAAGRRAVDASRLGMSSPAATRSYTTAPAGVRRNSFSGDPPITTSPPAGRRVDGSSEYLRHGIDRRSAIAPLREAARMRGRRRPGRGSPARGWSGAGRRR